MLELALLRFFGPDILAGSALTRGQKRSIAQHEELSELERIAGGEHDEYADPDDDEDGFNLTRERRTQPPPPPPAFSRGKKRMKWKKALYMAPIKALCEERAIDWSNKFAVDLGLTVTQLTGDREANYATLANAQIIITTPEKW